MHSNASAVPRTQYVDMGAQCLVRWKVGGDWGGEEWHMSQR